MSAKKKTSGGFSGYYRGVVTQIKSKSGKNLKLSLSKLGLSLEWTDAGKNSSIEFAIFRFKAIFEDGYFLPVIDSYANDDLRKIIVKGFKPQQGMSLTNQSFEAYIIKSKGPDTSVAYVVSPGSSIVGAFLNEVLLRDVTVSYKKLELRKICEFLFQNPHYTSLVARRLNMKLSGRDTIDSLSRCSITGTDIFRSSYFCDLAGMSLKDDRADFNPFYFSVADEKRSLWQIDPLSCQIRLDEEEIEQKSDSKFWINLDRYGNFLFYRKTEEDLSRLVRCLDLLQRISELADTPNIPLKREDDLISSSES